MRFRFGLPGYAVLLLLAGCSDAPATEQGGGLRFDPTPPPASNTDGGSDGGCNAAGDAGSGHAWSDLYRDYFGPTGIASCAGTAGACHGESTGLGAQASNFVCAGGVTGCYQGITSPAAGLVDPKTAPTSNGLYSALRKTCGPSGNMPKQPASVSFTPADLKRITDWIAAGAANN